MVCADGLESFDMTRYLINEMPRTCRSSAIVGSQDIVSSSKGACSVLPLTVFSCFLVAFEELDLTLQENSGAMAALSPRRRLHRETRAVHATGFLHPGRGPRRCRQSLPKRYQRCLIPSARKPMTGIAHCACATRGHAATAPPKPATRPFNGRYKPKVKPPRRAHPSRDVRSFAEDRLADRVGKYFGKI
jgi:hypothetical protein